MFSLLYVDDEPDLLSLGKLFLERGGDFHVTTAMSAHEGLEKLATGSFDAVISDYQMPVMDGIALLKEVRIVHGAIPFILFTGKGREEVVIEAINNGVDFYLQKGGAPKAQFAELRHKILVALERRRALDALRDSEQRLADIINFLPDATFAINTDGVVIAWNKAFEIMSGIPAASIIGKGNYEYAFAFYPERRPILIDLIRAPEETIRELGYNITQREGDVLIVETGSPQPLGKTGYFLGKASLLYDKNGRIAGAIESVRDITEQKHADQMIRESESKYRELVENANTIILKVDTSGRITFFNEFAQRFFGYGPDEILGKPITGTIFPLTGSDSDRDLHHMMEEIVSHPEDYTHNENENITKPGERVWIQWLNKPIYDEEGRYTGLLCIGTDITKRKRAEDELRKENEKNRTLMDHASDAIFIVDAGTGMLADANKKAQALVKRPLAELVTLNHLALYPKEFHDACGIAFQQIILEGAGLQHLVVIDREGRQIPVLASAALIDLGGRQFVMEILHDISEIQMAQDALRLANRKLNLLAEITRHDIRNKLTVMGGYLDMVKDRPAEPDYSMYMKKLESIVGNISQNIEFTRLYQNLGVAAPDWQNVHDVFFHACARIDIRKICVQSDTGALVIFADPLLERAFHNLVENVVQHGGNVTTIRISARESGVTAIIVIEDDGIGIPSSDKGKIFSKGYGKNTGLGLFLVQEILSITGITIQETGEYQKGARFEISVPPGAYRFPRKTKTDRCHILMHGPDYVRIQDD
ncbi:PAS domain S-box protein [Methanoregula sp.]|uniref:response regulator n=1 Tax=Methanoregula sp. TaxID=2052170 RepID=UPI003C78C2BB